MIKTDDRAKTFSSETLKAFVKLHEYKLNAKINARKADRLESRLDERLPHHDAVNFLHE